MRAANQKIAGVFQYFYHCAGEELPVRDVLNRQGHGHKTEPHYENLTENWCGKCMNNRIKSANRKNVKYLLLMTRYIKDGHPRNGEHLVVGYLYRAGENVWKKWNRSLCWKATPFDPNNPQECGFFAGDELRSHFVSADNAFIMKDVQNGRWKYLATEKETEKIVSHLKRHKNILSALRKKVAELKSQTEQHEYGKTRKQCEGCSR